MIFGMEYFLKNNKLSGIDWTFFIAFLSYILGGIFIPMMEENPTQSESECGMSGIVNVFFYAARIVGIIFLIIPYYVERYRFFKRNKHQ